MVVLDSLDEGLVGRQRPQGATHVSVDNLEAIYVARVDPAKSVPDTR